MIKTHSMGFLKLFEFRKLRYPPPCVAMGVLPYEASIMRGRRFHAYRALHAGGQWAEGLVSFRTLLLCLFYIPQSYY